MKCPGAKCQKCGVAPSVSELWATGLRLVLCKLCADAWWRDFFSNSNAKDPRP